LERVTQDGTKICAQASKRSFSTAGGSGSVWDIAKHHVAELDADTADQLSQTSTGRPLAYHLSSCPLAFSRFKALKVCVKRD
jgi:hypothetical protein